MLMRKNYVFCADVRSSHKLKVIIMATISTGTFFFLIIVLLISIVLLCQSKQNLQYLMKSNLTFMWLSYSLVEKKSMGDKSSFWLLVRPRRLCFLDRRIWPSPQISSIHCWSKSTNPSIFILRSFSVFPVCFFAYASLLCFPSSFLLLPLSCCCRCCGFQLAAETSL